MEATARACSNIAFIKYWGNRDHQLRIPSNSSLSMNLKELFTDTYVKWDSQLQSDHIEINEELATPEVAGRVSKHLDVIRNRLNFQDKAHVVSENNFPMGVGIASSASAFAALTLAGVAAANADLEEWELSALARIGSGSASRSIPGGFVEWHQGKSHETSFAETLAEADYWDLVDVIVIVSDQHKSVGSYSGHALADTSELQRARVAGAEERLNTVKKAIVDKDFSTFAEVVEYDSNLMHAIMMTSRPPLFYWQPATLEIMEKVRQFRGAGTQVCYTLDAGPNVHCICHQSEADSVREQLRAIQGVQDILTATPGGAAQVIA